jgi:endo-1,3(4)-beta-glucanase
MFGSLACVLVSSALVASLPSGNGSPGGSSAFGVLDKRGIFGPIATGSVAGIAGGQVACDAAPVSSFFAGLKPPVGEVRYSRRELDLNTP